jgi:hypothetical protein
MRRREANIVGMFVCLAILLSLRPGAVSAEIMERNQVGDWTLLFAADSSAGSALCNASRVNDQGVVFSIVASQENHAWLLLIGGNNLDLQLKPWSQFELVYAIDGAAVTRKAVATSASRIMILLGNTFASTDPLRHGSRIEIRAGEKVFAFSLAGSARALDAVLDCANQHLDFAEAKSAANPFVPSEPGPVSDATNAAQATVSPITDLSPTALTQPELIEERDVGGWNLTGPATGGDPTCMVTRSDVEGPILGITVQRPIDIWFFTLAYDSWQFERGAYYPIDYAIDNGSPVSTVAQAKSATLIVIPLGKTHAATEPFRHGKTLDFRMPDTIALFDLSGSPQALDALIDCAKLRLGLH